MHSKEVGSQTLYPTLEGAERLVRKRWGEVGVYSATEESIREEARSGFLDSEMAEVRSVKDAIRDRLKVKREEGTAGERVEETTRPPKTSLEREKREPACRWRCPVKDTRWLGSDRTQRQQGKAMQAFIRKTEGPKDMEELTSDV